MDEYRVPALFIVGTLVVAGLLSALTLYLRGIGLRLDKWAARKSPLTKEGREVILRSAGEFSLVSILPVALLDATNAPAALYLKVFLVILAVTAPVFYFRIKAVRTKKAIFKKNRAAKSKNQASAGRT